jgi:hypothetical protein
MDTYESGTSNSGTSGSGAICILLENSYVANEVFQEK